MTSGDRVKALWKEGEGQKKLVAHGVDPDHVGDDDLEIYWVKNGTVDIDDDAFIVPLLLLSRDREIHLCALYKQG